MSLPGAEELFRGGEPQAASATPISVVPDQAPETAAPKRPSGRVRHDEKMTVYVTSDELMDIEHTRLQLRRDLGLAVDRGRLVREAVALVLADYAEHAEDSALVRRLSES